MIDPQTIRQREERLCELMNERLGLAQPSLEKAVRRAGRRLPASQQKHAKVFVDALATVDHPALFAQLAPDTLARSETRLITYLEGIDRKKLRTDRLLKLVATLSMNLLVLAGIVIVVLRLRGFI